MSDTPRTDKFLDENAKSDNLVMRITGPISQLFKYERELTAALARAEKLQAERGAFRNALEDIIGESTQPADCENRCGSILVQIAEDALKGREPVTRGAVLREENAALRAERDRLRAKLNAMGNLVDKSVAEGLKAVRVAEKLLSERDGLRRKVEALMIAVKEIAEYRPIDQARCGGCVYQVISVARKALADARNVDGPMCSRRRTAAPSEIVVCGDDSFLCGGCPTYAAMMTDKALAEARKRVQP